MLIDGCDVDNKDGKETIAIRMGDNVSVANNTLRAGRKSARACRPRRPFIAAIFCSRETTSPVCAPMAPGCRSIPEASRLYLMETHSMWMPHRSPLPYKPRRWA